MSPGEFPPPPPGACFGRDGLIEKVVGLAENLNSIALIGPGGIGKTSVALVILHCDRIKDRFGDNRRFVRCDQFPPSRAHLLSRLSKVIGAGVENPEDLVPLRPHLSSKEMLVVLDNAESILDPQGPDGQDIYRLVEELSRFNNICLVVTSRITTIPPNCETIEVPTLSMEAACNAFYGIYKHGDRLEAIDNILKQLDFHPLSVTLLATVAHQNKWDDNRLAREWEQRQTGVLRTQHNESLAAAVELSLASPMFQTLGPDARELLGVIAFFPQGINENDLDRLFPTISDIATIFDKFCILSLTYRSNGFITMLVPLQDYLRPKDPFSSSLLLTTKEFYFTRMSIKLDRNAPKLREMQWITSEDVNVEHLLNVFTSVDSKSDGVWSACISFFYHLIWLKPRRTLLGTKIDGLPDDHPSKPECLFWLAWLLDVVGDCAGRKQLLTQALKLEMERGNEYRAAVTLGHLSDANRQLGLYKEGIRQMEEVLGACERIGNAGEHGEALMNLALLLYEDGQLDAAEEVASRAIALLPEKAQGLRVCRSHHTLGKIYHSKGEREKAIHHFKAALKIMSLSDWNDQLFWIHFDLALLFHDGDEFDDAHTHVERAKTHAVSNAYHLGRAVLLQARIHRQQSKLQDATSGALRALEIFEKLGTMSEVGICKDLLKLIEGAASCQNGMFVKAMVSPAPANSRFLSLYEAHHQEAWQMFFETLRLTSYLQEYPTPKRHVLHALSPIIFTIFSQLINLLFP